ncbi:5-carboxymethyl-2-hydroxymuconate Delta-isomerase [Kitasatospora sp. SUK 42]|uniref:5-carboxymethyl-2-hydroxymuconate Delta-isomerase n=1 Tax=Kitasatospora sp. SUK 42 TaxID=1588882 RepID=UPI0018CABC8D|nr:isomerase [Kitasatospora sp. SUK 42]MBV2155542.1 isomerase [Kitasatospora sp. SUK 42]
MPQISVDYSAGLTGTFDRRGLGLAINRLTEETIGAKPESCKTVFRPNEELVVGTSGVAGDAQVFVEFQIFPGRAPEARTALSEGVLALVAEYVRPKPGTRLFTAVSVTEIDDKAYRSATAQG